MCKERSNRVIRRINLKIERYCLKEKVIVKYIYANKSNYKISFIRRDLSISLVNLEK